jgi:hypothetical protein
VRRFREGGEQVGDGDEGVDEIDDVNYVPDGKDNAAYPLADEGRQRSSAGSSGRQALSSSPPDSADPKPAKKQRRHGNNDPASDELRARSKRMATSPRRPKPVVQALESTAAQTAAASAKSRGLAIDRNSVGASLKIPCIR